MMGPWSLVYSLREEVLKGPVETHSGFPISSYLQYWHLAQNEVNLTQHNQAAANDRMERRLIELSSRARRTCAGSACPPASW